MTTIWNQSEQHDIIRQQIRRDRFCRLVAAYRAAEKWEMPRSKMLFRMKLISLGGQLDELNNWYLGDLPAAGSAQPY